MVIYEVNLAIRNEIFNEYYNWLIPHVDVILKFPGFKTAEILKEKLDSSNVQSTHLTVRYILENEQSLDNYLNNHAATMRADAIQRFGDKFSAFRRIFHVAETKDKELA